MFRFTKRMALTGLLIAPLFSQATDKLFLENVELKCVADGVEIATEGPNHSEGLRPSEKYIALLGFAAQRNYKGVGNSGIGRELYLERVIQMLQANGFCMANKLDGGGIPTTQVGYGDIIRDKSNKAAPYLIYAVAGLRSREQKDGNTQSALNTKQIKEVVKYFGFQDESHIQNIFKHDGWSSLEPDQRQRLFSEHVENTSAIDPENHNSLRGMYAANEYGEGLKNCFSQMKLMQNSNTIFNLKGTKNGRRADNRKFCETIAKECKLESTTFCSVSTPTFTRTSEATKSTGGGANSGGRSIFDSVKGSQ